MIHDRLTWRLTWFIHIYICDKTRSYVWQSLWTSRVTSVNSSCQIDVKTDMIHTYIYMWQDSFICVTRVSGLVVSLLSMVRVRLTWRLTWFIVHMCDKTHSHVWKSIWTSCVTSVDDSCQIDMKTGFLRIYMWQDSFICVRQYLSDRKFAISCVTRLISMCESRHVWMSHVTHMHESCHTYICIMSRTWMSDGTHNHSHVTYGWVVAHICMSHVTLMDESCHTRTLFVAGASWQSLVWMTHVKYMNESCHTYE